MSARLRRAAKVVLEDFEDLPGLSYGQTAALSELAAAMPKTRWPSPRRKERLRLEAVEDRAARARTAKVRREVFARSGGACQVCLMLAPLAELLNREVRPATDLHHVLSGPDRKAKESAETCIAVCDAHHTGDESIHAGHLPTLEAAHRYCFENRMHEAAAALARRITKVLEARRFAAQGTEGV